MKRQLDKKEREMTEKGLKKRNKELGPAKRAVQMIQAQIDFAPIKREYDKKSREFNDIIRPLNQQVEDETNKLNLKKFTGDLNIITDDIINLESQLKDGVTVKQAVGVN